MSSVRTIIMLILCPAIAGVSEARTLLPKAQTIIAAAKRATGGATWDKPEGCIERGTHGDGAITYLTRFSLREYGMRTDGNRGGKVRSMGFDGKVRWQTAGPGKADIGSDPASLQEAIVTNYLSINGFFFPDRFPATFRFVRAATEGARRFDIVDITPKGGRPLEVWFDSRTHLIQRVVDTQGTPAVRVEASDYRRGADGLTIAYRLDVFGPDGSVMDRGAVASFQCGPIDRAIFTPPADH
jgi:hypothetical protein